MKASLPIYVCLISCGLICTDACGSLEQGVSAQEKAYIVNLHNDLRKLIANGKVSGQPRGINLKRMKWDDKLAKAAQQVTNTCKFQHVSIKDDRWYVGQNLFMVSRTNRVNKANWTQPIMASWFNEYKKYTYGPNFQPAGGHYTQVVWADTEYVGCGYTFFNDFSSFPYVKFYTCNYGPGGNSGGPPYKTGKSGCENLC